MERCFIYFCLLCEASPLNFFFLLKICQVTVVDTRIFLFYVKTTIFPNWPSWELWPEDFPLSIYRGDFSALLGRGAKSLTFGVTDFGPGKMNVSLALESWWQDTRTTHGLLENSFNKGNKISEKNNTWQIILVSAVSYKPRKSFLWVCWCICKQWLVHSLPPCWKVTWFVCQLWPQGFQPVTLQEIQLGHCALAGRQSQTSIWTEVEVIFSLTFVFF